MLYCISFVPKKILLAGWSLFSIWSSTHLHDLSLNTHLLFLLVVESKTLHRLNWDPHLQVKSSWLFCLTFSLQVITTHKLISKYLISAGRPQVVLATASLNYNETTVMPISLQSTDCFFPFCFIFFLIFCFFFSSLVGVFFFFAPSINKFCCFVFWLSLARPCIIGGLQLCIWVLSSQFPHTVWRRSLVLLKLN